MPPTKECSTCEFKEDICTHSEVRCCLMNSNCTHCGGTTYGHPYGQNESRHCRTCGAEWPVNK